MCVEKILTSNNTNPFFTIQSNSNQAPPTLFPIACSFHIRQMQLRKTINARFMTFTLKPRVESA